MREEGVYAEVIGNPIDHSLSPAIHGRWLDALAIAAAYRAKPVTREALAGYLAMRRDDPGWRGCNVTMPHKSTIVPLLDALSATAARIGSVNCVVRRRDRLIGYNSDVAGLAGALADIVVRDRRTVVLGAGGAAHAATVWLADRGARVVVATRRPGGVMGAAAGGCAAGRIAWSRAHEAIRGSALVINATPLGMAGHAPMPGTILRALAAAAPGASVLDMVYAPVETELIRAARAAGLRPLDGLTMLIAGARRSFVWLFDARPPGSGDAALRGHLADVATALALREPPA